MKIAVLSDTHDLLRPEVLERLRGCGAILHGGDICRPWILERLRELQTLDRPILIGAADKRFTAGDTERAHRLALRGGAAILRVHDVAAARRTLDNYLADESER